MPTLSFLGTERKVFTPVSSALGALSNGPGTMIVLVKQTTTGAQDFCGLTASAFASFYHGLINGTIAASTLGDDDDVGSVAAAATWPQDTTNWYLVACDWAAAAAPENFRWRNQTTLGAWTTSASATNAPAAKAGPGTGGFFTIGYLGDGSTGAKIQALVAVWNVRFSTSDYNAAWNKTSDLWTHPLGPPVFLTQLNSSTPTDLAGGSTYSSANSTGTALTGADPDNWTFDGVGSALARTLDPQIPWDERGPGDFGPNPFVEDAFAVATAAAAPVVDLTLTPGTPNVAWTGSTPALLLDAVRTPGTPNVAWTGSTPGLLIDIARTPAVTTVAWTGSTPAIVVDKTLTPGTPNVAWAGSTPAVAVDKTLAPGAGTVAWTGSTPSVVTDGSLTLAPGAATVAWAGSTPAITADLSLAPGVGVVAWSGSTPSVVLAGAVTLTPGAATVDWTGSTPTVSVVPDVVDVVLEPGGGGAAWDGLDDISTGQDRRLRPGTAVVAWSGSRATVRVTPGPPRIRLPKLLRRSGPVEAPAPPAKVIDRTLAPRAGSVAWAGSGTRVVAESFVPIQDYEELKARVAELEMEREEELVVLAALSSR